MEQTHCVAGSMLDGVLALERWSAGANKKKKQWSASMKKELVMRLLRGEPARRVSSEMAIPEYQLERWRNCALAGIDAALRERENDYLEACLEDAYRRIRELSSEVESLRGKKRSRRLSAAGIALPA